MPRRTRNSLQHSRSKDDSFKSIPLKDVVPRRTCNSLQHYRSKVDSVESIFLKYVVPRRTRNSLQHSRIKFDSAESIPLTDVVPRRTRNSLQHSRSKVDSVVKKSRSKVDPHSFRETMNRPHVPHWKIAMERELEAFLRLDVLEMCILPHGTNLISCRWLFITKYNCDGSLNKYKSRLVARGFSQVHGLDFNELFATTVTMAALRIFIARAYQYKYHCHGCDIETLFLHAILTVEC